MDKFFQNLSTTNLGLIQDFANPISKEKVRATLLWELFMSRGNNINSLGLADICDTPTENAYSEPQDSINKAGPSQTLTPPLTARPFTLRPASAGYALVV